MLSLKGSLASKMFIFHRNRGLAEKLKSFRIYANEYKLTEIWKDAFRIEDSEPTTAPTPDGDLFRSEFYAVASMMLGCVKRQVGLAQKRTEIRRQASCWSLKA